MDNSESGKFADEYYAAPSSSVAAPGEVPEYREKYFDIFNRYYCGAKPSQPPTQHA